MLFVATPELTRALTAMRVTQRVPVAPDATAARLLLDRRPPVVVRTLDLAQELASARRARLFVQATCSDWKLHMIRTDAMVVASELVTNAVRHARTAARRASSGRSVVVEPSTSTPLDGP